MVLSKEERKERKKKSDKKYYQEHIKESKERNKKWKKENPEYNKNYYHKNKYNRDFLEKKRISDKNYVEKNRENEDFLERRRIARKKWSKKKNEMEPEYNKIRQRKLRKAHPERDKKYRENSMWLIDIFLYPYECYICNRKYDKVCIDLHHINPKLKKFEARARGYLANLQPLELIEEICKCVILCSNCHRLVEHKKVELGEIKNRLV